MLDLVSNETKRIDSKFLEPACGDGNFLAEVLKRKLKVVKRRYRSNQLDFERYCFQAVGSVYGVDILADNVQACRKRLLGIIRYSYRRLYGDSAKTAFMDAIEFVLSRNILHGDALTLKLPGDQTPITFSEWSFTVGSLVKRVDYEFHALIERSVEGDALFSDLGEMVFIPKPSKEFKPVHFLEVINATTD